MKEFIETTIQLLKRRKYTLYKIIGLLTAFYGLKKAMSLVLFMLKTSSNNYYAKVAYLRTMEDSRTIVDQISQIHINFLPKANLERKILNADIHQLTDMLNNNETTSLQLVLTFIRRCATVGINLNAVCHFHFSSIEQAIECDKKRGDIRTDKKKLPCLFGIPVSLTDNYVLAKTGTFISEGALGYPTDFEATDGLLVEIIKNELGGIPFVKSNMSSEFDNLENNSVYGLTKNSYNRKRTPGWSSGGEGALISSACSPLGFATDVAGSIRTPSQFSGVYGFMISPHRVTNKGVSFYGTGTQDFIKLHIGMIGKSVRDLELVTKYLVSNQFMIDNDFYLEEKIWNNSLAIQKKRMKIAFLPKPEYFEYTEGQKRVMESAISGLREKGHEVIEFDYPNTFKLVESFIRIGETLIYVSADKLRKNRLESRLLRLIQKIPYLLKKACKSIIITLQSSERMKSISKTQKRVSIEDLMKDYEYLQIYSDEVQKKLKHDNIDAVIIPGLSVAYKHGTSKELLPTHISHIFPNAAGLCAGSVPITRANTSETSYSDKYNDSITMNISNNLIDSEGLPLGLQVCSSRNNDESCLRVMSIIEDIFKYKHINI